MITANRRANATMAFCKPRRRATFIAGDTARAATTSEVKDLRREARELKEVVAEQALELRLLKKSLIVDGGDEE